MGQLATYFNYCVHGQIALNDSDQTTIEEQKEHASHLQDSISKKEAERVELRKSIMRMSDNKGKPLPGNESTWKMALIKYNVLTTSITRLLSDFQQWEHLAAISEHTHLVKGNQQLHKKSKDLQKKLQDMISSHEDLPVSASETESQLVEHKRALDTTEAASLNFRSLVETDVEDFTSMVQQWKQEEDGDTEKIPKSKVKKKKSELNGSLQYDH
jgi:hypothetical protein